MRILHTADWHLGDRLGRVDRTDDLRTRLRTVLSAYKVPRRVLVVADDEVPTLSSGKVDLRALKELFGAP